MAIRKGALTQAQKTKKAKCIAITYRHAQNVSASDADDEGSNSDRDREDAEAAVERSSARGSSSENSISDEGSSSEKSAAELSDVRSSSSEKLAVERSSARGSSSENSVSDEGSVELSDEGSSSETSKAELSDARDSSSEETDDGLSQQPLSASRTPPLEFPASPAPHEDMVYDDEFNMEDYDQQSNIVYNCYPTEEEYKSPAITRSPTPEEADMELDQLMDIQDGQDVPFFDHYFESDSPFSEDSDSQPPQAPVPVPVPVPFAEHLVESVNDSASQSDDIASVTSEREWIDNKREEILEHYLYDLRMFSHQIQYNTTSTAAHAISTTLDGNLHQPLQSTFKVEKLVKKLSNLNTNTIHMCINSCCAFDGPFAERDHCPFCNHARRNRKGLPYKIFRPIPVAPRLQAIYANPDMAKAMRYRANYHNESNDTQSPSPPDWDVPLSSLLKDIFDGQHYRRLCVERVKVPSENEEGFKTLEHTYFDDERDVALGLALDGFTFYESLGKSAQKTKYNTWSLVLVNYNLDPTIRTHRKHVIPLGMIPGPGSPKHIGSFLHWLHRELIMLADGVRAYDHLNQTFFLLHAYLIIIIGDMPAIAHIMDMKGHIGKCPCRACWVTGKRDRTNPQSKIHYPVHTDSDRQERHNIQDLLDNPRTHQSFYELASEIVEAGTLAGAEAQRTRTGLNLMSVLWGLPGIDFERSFPHDLMHLIFLNACPNLVAWWTGTFKNIDTTQDSFRISIDSWKRIGQRIVESMELIPVSFIRQLPDISTLGHTYLAEGWSFWLLHIAPYALDRVLPVEHYSHLMDLVAITRRAMSFDLTEEEVLTSLQEKCTNWVMDYEQLYYQYKEERTSACMATIHAIIHLPTDLWNCGPAWAHWAFVMEREVQWCKQWVRDSRKEPFAHLSCVELHREQIHTIMLQFDLEDELDIRKRVKGDSGDSKGTKYESYDDYEFLPPSKRTVQLSDDMREEVAQFVIANRDPDLPIITELEAMHCVPRDGIKWGKMTVNRERITASWAYSSEKYQRRANYVRYHVLLPGQDVQQPTIHYGRLDEIWALQMTPVPDLELYCAHGEVTTIVVALVRLCITHGRDASIEKVYYSRLSHNSALVDISFIKAVVGRAYSFRDDGRYAIIDRLPAEQCVSFVDRIN